MAETIRHKRGDVREDGMIFVQYNRECHNGEYWVTPTQFKKNNKHRERARRRVIKERQKTFDNHPRSYNYGDIREDGMVFVQYHISCKNFERWVSPTQFHNTKKRKRFAQQNRYNNDPLHRLKEQTRTLIGGSFRKFGFSKSSNTCKILGCSYEEFVQHISSKFTEGMTLDNQGKDKWELDHIFPLAAAKNETEIIALNHYTNFQPLWAADNNFKRDKYCPKELEEYLNKMIEVA